MTPPARLVHLHRNDLTYVLVTGGTAIQRTQVAIAFHRESPVRRGPFICLDGTADESVLRASLQARTSSIVPVAPGDPLRAAEHGTLFVDCVGRLSMDTQRLLLVFLLRSGTATGEDREMAWPGRLIAGIPEPLIPAVRSGRFLAQLCDALDKVRVELPEEIEEHVA